jgi:autotransporter translocation and assembly factor TamB
MKVAKLFTFKKILFCFVASVVLLLTIFIFALPSILSSERGLQKSLKFINNQISGNIEISKASFRWLGEQNIKDLKIKDHNGHVVLAFDSMNAESPLLKIIFNPFSPGKVHLENLSLEYVELLVGLNNIQEALSKKSSIHYPIDTSPLTLQNLNVNANVLKKWINFEVQFNNLKIKSIEGTKVEGILTGISLQNLLEIKTKEQAILELEQNRELKLQAKINTFIVDIKNLVIFLKTGKWEESNSLFE